MCHKSYSVVVSKLFWYRYLKLCKVAVVMTKTNIKYMTIAKEKKFKNVSKSFEICRLLKEFLKYKLLTSEVRSKTPEMELVCSWWDFFFKCWHLCIRGMRRVIRVHNVKMPNWEKVLVAYHCKNQYFFFFINQSPAQFLFQIDWIFYT